jgi:spermidine/putrescine transport system permease protein
MAHIKNKMKATSKFLTGERVLIVYAIFFLLFLYIPVLFLPLFSFSGSQYMTFPITDWTLERYVTMWKKTKLLEALYASIKVGIFASVISTILGILVARAMTRYLFPLKRTVMGFILLPMVFPEIIMGVGLLIFVIFVGMQLSLITVTAGHILICLPFSTVILISRFEGFDRSLEEASLDLGENAWQTFRRITFPIVGSGILASLLLTFTISFDEFLIAFFLSGDDPTLPIYIYGQLRHVKNIPYMLSLGSIILLVSFVTISFAEWIRRRGMSSKKVYGLFE